MKICPECGEPASLWGRDLFSGICNRCRRKTAAAKDKVRREQLLREEAQQASVAEERLRAAQVLKQNVSNPAPGPICHMCRSPAVTGACPKCGRFYCSDHGGRWSLWEGTGSGYCKNCYDALAFRYGCQLALVIPFALIFLMALLAMLTKGK